MLSLSAIYHHKTYLVLLTMELDVIQFVVKGEGSQCLDLLSVEDSINPNQAGGTRSKLLLHSRSDLLTTGSLLNVHGDILVNAARLLHADAIGVAGQVSTAGSLLAEDHGDLGHVRTEDMLDGTTIDEPEDVGDVEPVRNVLEEQDTGRKVTGLDGTTVLGSRTTVLFGEGALGHVAANGFHEVFIASQAMVGDFRGASVNRARNEDLGLGVDTREALGSDRGRLGKDLNLSSDWVSHGYDIEEMTV